MNFKGERRMNSGKSQVRRRKSRTRRNGFLRKTIFFIITFADIVVFGTFNGSGKVSAHDDRPESSGSRKYYKSIEVKAGDTLWNIAEEYMDESYRSVSEYMNELIEINQLSSGKIQEGCYLTIVYYL